MKKYILTILWLTPLLSNFASTLVFKDGQILSSESVSFSGKKIRTDLDKTTDISEVRAIITKNVPQKIINPKYTEIIDNLIKNSKIKADRSNRILHKIHTFTLDQNKYWSEELEVVQYVSSSTLNKFEFKLEFNSNYEKVEVKALLYTTAAGGVKLFPENSINIASRFKDYPQLKVLTIKLKHLTDDAIVMVKASKEQFRQSQALCRDLSKKIRISENLKIIKSEVILNITQKYKETEVHSELSDSSIAINYNIVKTDNYISRQWRAMNLLPDNGNKVVLELVTNKQTKSNKVNIFNQELKDQITIATQTQYYKELIKLKEVDLIFNRIKSDFFINHSIMGTDKKTIDQLIKTKVGSIGEIIPLLLAALEYNKFNPELYIIDNQQKISENHKMGLVIDKKLYFLKTLTNRPVDLVGTCYYGYNLGAEIKIPHTQQNKKGLSVLLSIEPGTLQENGKLIFNLNRKLSADELVRLKEKFPISEVEENQGKTNIYLPHRVQLITIHLLSLRIPDLRYVLKELDGDVNLDIEVVLPKGWRVEELPDDKLGKTTYQPTVNGFMMKTAVHENSLLFKTPIILKFETASKRWFD